MGLSPKSNYEKTIVSCFDIEEVPRSPGKWNWNWLYFLPFIFTYEQGDLPRPWKSGFCNLSFRVFDNFVGDMKKDMVHFGFRIKVLF